MPQNILDQLNLTLDDVADLPGRDRTRLLNYLLRWDHVTATHACLDVLIPQNPTLVSLLDLRARAFLAQERYDDALAVMQQRLQMRTSMTAYALEARIVLAKGDPYAARSLAQKLVDDNPDRITAWSTLGEIQLAMGDIDAAFASYRRITELSPRSRAYLRGMIGIYQARADWVTASGYATRLLRIAEEEGLLPITTLRRLRDYFAASDETTRLADIDAELAHRRAEELAEMQLRFAEEETLPPTQPPHPPTTQPGAEHSPCSAAGTSPASGIQNPKSKIQNQAPAIPISDAERARITTAVREIFGFDTLQPGQLETIACALRDEDVLAVLPTGGGKSLCYQLPALLDEEGTTLVISPLIALMKDQVESLPAPVRQHAIAINSTLTNDALRRQMARVAAGDYKLVYAAPERLRQPPFLHQLRKAGVRRLVIDEAHCVSVWGHDFRPDYLIIKRVREALGNPSLVAVTATAPPRVRRDILQQLGDMRIVTGDSVRPNLRFEVFYARNTDEKLAHLIAFCKAEDGSGIIYAGTRKRCERIAALLRKYGVSAGHYHAGINDRAAVQDAFMTGKTRVIVATIAFGMGIDKADVRFIVHFAPPDSLEAYYQEAGRAGRDGNPARCLLMYTSSDRGVLTRHAHEGVLPVETLRAVYAGVKRQLNGNDIGIIDAESLAQTLRIDDITLRVALSTLEEAELRYRGPDLPRMIRIGYVATSSEPHTESSTARKQFADFVQSLPHSPAPLHPPSPTPQRLTLYAVPGIIHNTALTLDTFEPTLLAWADAGWLTYEPGLRGMAIRILPPPADAAERIAALLERYETIQDQRVDEITAYVETGRCRHGHINAYLGGRIIEHCNACDNCTVAPPLPDPGLPDERAQAQSILRVLAASYGWGRASLTSIMQGDPDAASSAQQHKDFGALAFRSKTATGALIKRLEQSGFIQARTLNHGGVALGITPKGRAAIENASALDDIVRPQRAKPARRPRRSRRTRVPSRQVTLTGEPVVEPKVDEALLESLKAWRLAQAQAQKVPAYVIFPNNTLKEIAKYAPTSLTALESIKGIGPRKLAKYGEPIIELVKAHLAAIGL